MLLNSIFRRSFLAVLLLAGASTAVACGDMLVDPAPAGRSAALALRYQLDPRFAEIAAASAAAMGGSGSAFDKADRVWVQVTGPDSVLVDTTLAFAPEAEEVALEIPLPAGLRHALLELELRQGATVLFVGQQQLDLQGGGTVAAEVGLMPMPATMTAQDSARITALGDTVRLDAAAVFATGDTITEVPTQWSSTDPAVVAITTDGRVVSVGNGTTQVIASVDAAGTVTDTVEVTVQQVASRIELTSDTVPMRQSATLSAQVVDANGYAVPGAPPLAWSSADAGVAQVDASGTVTGVVLGETLIEVTGAGVSGSAPVRVSPLVEGSIAAGNVHSCALDAEGNSSCWGGNALGQLGTGDNSARTTPTYTTTTPEFQMVRAAGPNTCALTADGAAYCWGDNMVGQLGDGTTAASNVPVAVAGGLQFVEIGVGSRFACGLTAAGATYCWGDNSNSQLGATTADLCGTAPNESACSTTPVQVSGGLSFASLEVGGYFSCGITAAGQAYCWGWNAYGALGDGTNTDSATPVAVSGGLTFEEIAGGTVSTCGLTTAGAAHCWGYNAYGQLGTGTTTTTNTPVPVAGGLAFESLAANRENNIYGSTCGIAADGTTYCWGANQSRQLGGAVTGEVCGAGAQLIDCSTTPVQVTGGVPLRAVQLGLEHACGISDAGEIYCWGARAAGGLGDGGEGGNSFEPTQVSGTASYVTISAAERGHTCALTTSGAAHCWGQNISGALGNGTTASSATPVPVAGGLTFATIETGAGFSCGLTGAGDAHCWGVNNYGQLGDGTTTSSSTPVAVAGGLTFQSLASSYSFSDGISGGSRYWWGQGGAGDALANPTPNLVADTIPYVTSVSGGEHTCVLTAEGEALCRGDNTYGQLGDGTNTAATMPVPVAGGITFSKLAAGDRHTCGIATDGTAYCWGDNGAGALGDGTTTPSTTPVAVSGGLQFASLTGGLGFTCGIATDGTGYCWGANPYGARGTGTGHASPTPSPLPIAADLQSLSAGHFHTCAVTVDGDAYCWGQRGSGQLGDGTFGYATTPVAVAGGPTIVTSVAATTLERPASRSGSLASRLLQPRRTIRTVAHPSAAAGCGPDRTQLVCTR